MFPDSFLFIDDSSYIDFLCKLYQTKAKAKLIFLNTLDINVTEKNIYRFFLSALSTIEFAVNQRVSPIVRFSPRVISVYDELKYKYRNLFCKCSDCEVIKE